MPIIAACAPLGVLPARTSKDGTVCWMLSMRGSLFEGMCTVALYLAAAKGLDCCRESHYRETQLEPRQVVRLTCVFCAYGVKARYLMTRKPNE